MLQRNYVWGGILMFDEVRDVTALLNSNVLLIAGTIIALVVIVLIALIVRKKLFIKLVSFLNKHIDALLNRQKKGRQAKTQPILCHCRLCV